VKVLFSEAFADSVKKHIAIKDAVRKKVDMVISNPVALGEPLKGNLRAYLSCPVKRNFLIIFLYCRSCRKRGDDSVVACADCPDQIDETLRFIALGPHDSAYGKR